MRLLALVGVVVATGCAAPPPPPADPRVTVLPDSQVVVVQPPQVSTNATGITHVSVQILNPNANDATVMATTDWFDSNQHSFGGVLAAPIRMVVPRLGSSMLETVSPNARAVRFQVRIEPGL